MKSRILYFPRGIEIEITPKTIDDDVVTDKFRAQIRKAFHDYTEGTNPAYRFSDQLDFIKRIRELNMTIDYGEVVNDYIRGVMSESGDMSKSDLGDPDRLEEFAENNVCEARKEWAHWDHDHHMSEPASKFVLAAIQEVVNYHDKQ